MSVQAMTAEHVGAAYFLYLIAISLFCRRPRSAAVRTRIVAASLTMVIVLAASHLFAPRTFLEIVRPWVPALWLLAGYWVSGWYYEAPMVGVERTLLAFDQWVARRQDLDRWFDWMPRAVVEVSEGFYLLCHVFILSGPVLLTGAGEDGAIDRYWVIVSAAAFLAYACMPWIQTRPPRLLPTSTGLRRASGRSVMRSVNAVIVGQASIGANTFPSGHVSAAFAAALALSDVVPSLWPGVLAVAIAIGLSTVIGRYHYVLDALAGAALSVLVWLVFLRLWPV